MLDIVAMQGMACIAMAHMKYYVFICDASMNSTVNEYWLKPSPNHNQNLKPQLEFD